MRTNRPNWDHDKRVEIIPQEIKLCNKCGSYMVQRYEVYSCTACRSSTFDLVYETNAADYRMNKMTEREEASRQALELTEQISRFFSEDMFILWLNTAPADPFDFLDYAQTEVNRILAACFDPDDFLREPLADDLPDVIAIEAEKVANWLPVHSHTPVKVTSSARWFRHGGTHPLSVDGAAYTWCTKCGEIISLDNELARKAWAESEGVG